MRILKLVAIAVLLLLAAPVAQTAAADPCANPTIQVKQGKDVYGTSGPDVIRGTPFADFIVSGGGNDVICGNGGEDTIDGGSEDDHIYGGGGNDHLYGEVGDDVLYGGDGRDHLWGDTEDEGEDFLYGGRDNDRFFGGFTDNSAALDHCQGGPGTDREYVAASCDVSVSIEQPFV